MIRYAQNATPGKMEIDTMNIMKSKPSSGALSASVSPIDINELGDVVFQVLTHCANGPTFSGLNQLAAELGVPVDQLVAASIAGTILKHFDVLPRIAPANEAVAFEA